MTELFNDADHTRLNGGEQRRVTREDPQFTLTTRYLDFLDQTREHLLLCADDVQVVSHCHITLMGLDPTRILVMSQVLLSFGIALALVPLLIFTSDKSLMGELVNSVVVKRIGWAIVLVVVALNLWLLVGTALGL
jgi:Mn2+/Fe2+ NRAMP family transporter